MAILTIIAPIILELLKLFFSAKTDAALKQEAAKVILEKIAAINRAMAKAAVDGDTKDIEDIINKK